MPRSSTLCFDRQTPVHILGISAYYHDSAASIVREGRIIAAAQEERFTRKKHDASFPYHAIRACLDTSGMQPEEIDWVVFYDKPFLKFERLLETYLAFAPRGFSSFRMSMPLWFKEKLFQKRLLLHELKRIGDGVDWAPKLLFTEHHLSHAASAFFPSPFNEAAILTMDGVGEWASTSAAIGKGNRVELFQEIHFPHSLGLLYSAFTYYAGFKVNSGEYKLMGLAPFGEPKFVDGIFEHIIDLKADGSFRLNLDYFDYCTGLTMTNDRFDRLFGAPARRPEDPITKHYKDVAASAQAALEEVVLRLTRSLARQTGTRNLCLAGGVALNCVANGKILRDCHFEKLWIQPAAGDAGGAIGAALAAYHLYLGLPRSIPETDGMNGAYLGPCFSQSDIEARLRAVGATFDILDDASLIQASVNALAAGQALGWFQGRMEFGPRALGSRSILADPRPASMQSILNLKVKFRESFRPFAPSVLRENLGNYFDLDCDSPYMSLTAGVHRTDIPAVTHVDNSARIQTVHYETNARYHDLLTAFHKKTGCPVLVNTSFNIRGEPIVGTPEDAFRCFMGTGIEVLAIGNCFLRKETQNPSLIRDNRDRFDAD